MANVFTRSNDATQIPNRNTFDGSFVNNLTLKMGMITPCFCKEVVPGDSFKIDATFGFNFQPFVFPVQTDMRVDLHFFYVRNRALWNGWKDFITKNENLEGDSVPPFILLDDENRDIVDTGNIGDYFGLPTVYYSRSVQDGFLPFQKYVSGKYFVWAQEAFGDVDWSETFSNPNNDKSFFFQTMLEYAGLHGYGLGTNAPQNYMPYAQSSNTVSSKNSVYFSVLPAGTTALNLSSLQQGGTAQNGDPVDLFVIYDLDAPYDVRYGLVFNSTTDEVLYEYNPFGIERSYEGAGIFTISNLGSFTSNARLCIAQTNNKIFSGSLGTSPLQVPLKQSGEYGIQNQARALADLPFRSVNNPNGEKISALPFRAYELIYNSFYRDDRNNPLIIRNKPYYNIFLENKFGGADSTKFHLFRRNWEQDVYTTAVQSPQQGVLPLVGVTASGEMTFSDDEGKTYYLQAQFGNDGHTITGIKSYSSDMPVGTLRAMVDTISTGISINDFRNVNALQRWLETNMRKGLRYKDQIEAHFGTSPTYSELDMPEFIGGMSRNVSMNKVVQTSEGANPLGTLAGSASVIGDAGSSVSHYCEEHGFIIGLVTVSPKPVYSQNTPKYFFKHELLDYYFPEFAHIGFQPILKKELALLQTDPTTKDEVFGYQRAWYDYLSNVDEVHGDFRSNMRDYIIQRVYDEVPELGEDFLTISPNDANDVFAVNDDSDKIFGQIYFDVKMKRPLPSVGTPKLEVS